MKSRVPQLIILMRLVWWLLLAGYALSVAGDDNASGAPPPSGPAGSSLKTEVDSLSDFFPYDFPGELEMTKIPDGRRTSYMRPGFISLYPEFAKSFFLSLLPAKHCMAVYLCITTPLPRTTKGLVAFNVQDACTDSLRFLPYEQMVYHFQGGQATAYVNVRSLIEISSEGEDTDFEVEVFTDYDNEDFEGAPYTTVTLDLLGKELLLLTSSPYCHAILYNSEGMMKGEIVHVAPTSSNINDFYKTALNDPPYAPYVITETMAGSKYKSDGPRSDMYDIIKNQKVDVDEDCCPSLSGVQGFSMAKNWPDRQDKAVANAYTIDWLFDSCNDGDDPLSSPLMSMNIDVGDECEWMRLCFDDKQDTWCEKEGNVLNLLFMHEVFIPTDTDQAQPFGVPQSDLKHLRINFLRKLPAIELGYVFSSIPAVTHTMHLKVYEDNGMDPTKLFLHVVKSGSCRSRVASNVGRWGAAAETPSTQCLLVSNCECYRY